MFYLNGVTSLISLSVFSWLVYMNKMDLCVLILYPVTLLYSLISSSNFLEVFFVFFYGFLCKGSCHLQTVSFTSSFPIWIPCIYFSSLIVVSKTSKATLNSSDESGHPCLVADFRGKAFIF